MARPCNPIKKQPPAQASYLGGGCYSDFTASAHTPAVHRQRVLNGQAGDQQGLVIEQLGVLGDLVGVARGVGSLQGGKDRVVRVQLQYLRALDASALGMRRSTFSISIEIPPSADRVTGCSCRVGLTLTSLTLPFRSFLISSNRSLFSVSAARRPSSRPRSPDPGHRS